VAEMELMVLSSTGISSAFFKGKLGNSHTACPLAQAVGVGGPLGEVVDLES
jgi:hypothetical protein